MKRLTTLTTATAASAFACATTALAGAAALAQDDLHQDEKPMVDEQMTVEGQAHAPACISASGMYMGLGIGEVGGCAARFPLGRLACSLTPGGVLAL